jgi:PAS domain S-box-containing protein
MQVIDKPDAAPALYNSRVLQIYLDYLRIVHPDLNISELLDYSGITPDEIADTAHWFTQRQADRFYEIVAEKTGDPQIARKAGRFSASSEGLSIVQQYVIGLLSIETALLSMAKIHPLLTRAADISVRKLGSDRIEIIATPGAGVEEKPYQCENRLGSFEALPKLFTNSFGTVDHPECIHKGGRICRYIVSWQSPPSLKLKLIRNYFFILSILAGGFFFFFFPMEIFVRSCLLLLSGNATLFLVHAHQRSRELEKIIENRHFDAEERIKQADTRYNNSLLAQEIGQATAAILNIDELMQKLATLMQNRLDFDRGLIMLANQNRSRLVYSAGYGYSQDEKEYLKNTSFSLENKISKGFFVRSFLDQKHLIVSNVEEMIDTFSEKSRDLIREFKVRALLCVPIVFKGASMGILAVDNIKSKAPLQKSDIHLLEGIASQIAISINNAKSFQKLQESEIRYRQTLESITEGFFEIDLERRIRFCNKALSQLLGCPAEELVGRPFDSHLTSESLKRLVELFDNILTSREPVLFSQFEVRGRNDEPIPVDLSASLIVDTCGDAKGYRGILRDAKERLRLEKQRAQLKNQLLRAQKMEAIGTLAGGITHNFNNWLAGILGNVTLIRMEANHAEKVIERAGRIERIIENAAKMTQQLLGYARAGSYEVKPLNLNSIIKESADTFAVTKKEVALSLDLHPSLKTVMADKSQMEQVFWNLYVNAVDAMPRGGKISIKTENTTAEELKERPFSVTAGDYVSVEFSDSGNGIDPEHIENIFEPFFTTKNGKGSGLGLASAFGIIKGHNGYIDVSSQKNSGTTFKLFLPAVEATPAAVEGQAAACGKGCGTILMVDDEAMILDTSQQLLTRLGYTVLKAQSGHEALEKYGSVLDSVDLAIIDMIMPEMSGRELYMRIKEIRPDIKTLLCSGYSMNEIAQEIMDKGCDGFLQKPFTLNQLSRIVREIIRPDTTTDP